MILKEVVIKKVIKKKEIVKVKRFLILKDIKEIIVIIYFLWFGINRKFVDINNIFKGFFGKRDDKFYYGIC